MHFWISMPSFPLLFDIMIECLRNVSQTHIASTTLEDTTFPNKDRLLPCIRHSVQTFPIMGLRKASTQEMRSQNPTVDLSQHIRKRLHSINHINHMITELLLLGMEPNNKHIITSILHNSLRRRLREPLAFTQMNLQLNTHKHLYTLSLHNSNSRHLR